MPVDRSEARTLLRDVEGTEKRVREFLVYSHTGDQLILWGVLWAIGYAGTHLLASHAPQLIVVLWFGVIAIGALASVAIVARSRRSRAEPKPPLDIRPGIAVFATLFFIWFWIYLGHLGWREQVAFAPTLFGTVFFVAGLWAGRLLSICGTAVVAVTLAGYVWSGDWFDIWMAVVGSGALIGAGLWLRS